jgi:beta-glucosidase
MIETAMHKTHSFPHGFVWGTATSSYQIEGATAEAGRCPGIWDTFSAVGGHIEDGSNAAVACDHYHRFADDVRLMAELGAGAYRFSVSWPRVLPRGTGVQNPVGLDFYDRLTDALLDAGITPWVTLYHWDLPQILQDRGGWPSRPIVGAFSELTDVVTRRLGDRVRHWCTHNEPYCTALLGYQSGEHAPGIRDWAQSLAASHHVLLSHGAAVPIIRQNITGASVGIVLNATSVTPASPSHADVEAARHVDGLINRWYLDPLYGRGYPADVVADLEARGYLHNGLEFVKEGDLATIASATDFLGINCYSRTVARSEDVPEEENSPRTIPEPADEDRTDMGWEVWPRGLYDLLVRLTNDYPVGEIVITENGAAYGDAPDASGRVHDVRRIAYHRSHLQQCLCAIDDGVPLSGYFVWSLMDNFEWAFGYRKRFGLIWVDFDTQERVLKDSAHWYAAVIRNNSLPGAHDGELAAGQEPR